ncbi:MAG: hypothetical protein DWQ05_06530 [Calditrichaeota bacterium]|nr:MAG: hypothetical protein DWQ05_06530 [Calditrichota bacterium]
MPNQQKITYIAAFLFLVCTVASAQQNQVLPITKIQEKITIDARFNETVWQSISPLKMVSSFPVENALPSEKTEIRIAYDDKYIYVSGQFFMSNSQDIRGNSFSRDGGSQSDDYFGFILDSYNDNENALGFITTPAGIRIDQSIYNDAQGFGPNEPINMSWNTFWDVETRVTDAGWFAEMRIPFSSLQFQESNGTVVMGLHTWRWIGKKSESVNFPAFPQKFDMGFIKPSIAQKISFSGIKNQKPVYITPYVLTGYNHEFDLNNDETKYVQDKKFTKEIGLDLKYSLTSNLTLDLTVNTDFAQIEADDEEVNLTRFSLFFPEKRLFFQERSSIFDFDTGGRTRLFYSRRIGIDEDGNIIPIYGGARLVGRVGNWDLGFMDMQTKESELLPSENFSVLRLRRQIFNAYSNLGSMVTARLGRHGDKNIAYGIDTDVRLHGDDYLSFTAARTYIENKDEPVSNALKNSGRLNLSINRRAREGFGYGISSSWAGKDYDPGVGFVFRSDFTRFGGRAGYTWRPNEQSFLQNLTLRMRQQTYFRNSDKEVETVSAGPQMIINFRNTAFTFSSLETNYESLIEEFELTDDIIIEPGKYRFTSFRTFISSPGSRLFHSRAFFVFGNYFDGFRSTFSLSPEWIISKYFTAGGQIEYNKISFDGKREDFRGDVYQLRLKAAVNVKLSSSALIQYNTAEERITTNFRMRFNLSEGNDFYLVYNEGTNLDLQRELPFLQRSANRTFLIKVNYTGRTK